MQPIPSTSNQKFFLCRSCYQLQPNQHSQKQCLKDKRDVVQGIEDRQYEREKFATNNKVRIISKTAIKYPEVTVKALETEAITAPEVAVESSQIVETQQKESDKPKIIAAIFKRPRVLRRRIAPVARPWSYISSLDQNKELPSTVSKKPVAFNIQSSEATPYKQPERQQFGGNRHSYIQGPTALTQSSQSISHQIPSPDNFTSASLLKF